MMVVNLLRLLLLLYLDVLGLLLGVIELINEIVLLQAVLIATFPRTLPSTEEIDLGLRKERCGTRSLLLLHSCIAQ
jgi:hypothetical protein